MVNTPVCRILTFVSRPQLLFCFLCLLLVARTGIAEDSLDLTSDTTAIDLDSLAAAIGTDLLFQMCQAPSTSNLSDADNLDNFGEQLENRGERLSKGLEDAYRRDPKAFMQNENEVRQLTEAFLLRILGKTLQGIASVGRQEMQIAQLYFNGAQHVLDFCLRSGDDDHMYLFEYAEENFPVAVRWQRMVSIPAGLIARYLAIAELQRRKTSGQLKVDEIEFGRSFFDPADSAFEVIGASLKEKGSFWADEATIWKARGRFEIYLLRQKLHGLINKDIEKKDGIEDFKGDDEIDRTRALSAIQSKVKALQAVVSGGGKPGLSAEQVSQLTSDNVTGEYFTDFEQLDGNRDQILDGGEVQSLDERFTDEFTKPSIRDLGW